MSISKKLIGLNMKRLLNKFKRTVINLFPRTPIVVLSEREAITDDEAEAILAEAEDSPAVKAMKQLIRSEIAFYLRDAVTPSVAGTASQVSACGGMEALIKLMDRLTK